TAPPREIERIDVHGNAAARHHQVYRLIILGLGQSRRLVVDERMGVAQPGAEPGIIFQRADTAVDVDRRVRLGVAGIGDGDGFIARAVRDQDVGDYADELSSRGIAQPPQRTLAFAAREFERTLKVEALRRHGRQLIARDRIDERGFDALPALPAAGQKALERLWRRGHGSLPRTIGVYPFL